MFTPAGFLSQSLLKYFAAFRSARREKTFFSPLEKNLCQKYRSHSGFTVTSTDCTKESSILNLWALFDETKCRALHKKSSWGMSSIHGVMGHLTCSLFRATLWFWLAISKRCACSDIAKLASVWTFPKITRVLSAHLYESWLKGMMISAENCIIFSYVKHRWSSHDLTQSDMMNCGLFSLNFLKGLCWAEKTELEAVIARLW